MRIPRIPLTVWFTCLLFASCSAQQAPPPLGEFLERYCVRCHSGEKPKARLDLAGYRTSVDVLADRALFEDLLDVVAAHEMPPEGKEQPTREERARVVEWLRGVLEDGGPAHPPLEEIDPGRVTMRRLNRREYRNTIRDLVGVDYEPTADFPADDIGYGYDNNGDVLTLSPLLLERYLTAAEAITREAILTEDPDNPEVRRFEAEDLPSSTKGGTSRGFRSLSSSGSLTATVVLPRDGIYRVRARVTGDQAGPEKVKGEWQMDRRRFRRFTVKVERPEAQTIQAEIRARGGKRSFAIAFTNDYYKPDHPDRGERDRNMAVDWVEIIGPVDRPEVPASHLRIVTCEPELEGDWLPCAREILTRFATRAYRRPVTDSEVERLLELVRLGIGSGETFAGGISLAVQAILVSPHFLFRVEGHSAPNDPTRVEPVSEHALASRLSYFLWSSMPDDRLLELATAGELRGVLDEEVSRMLRDPRASALVDGFATQWLQLPLLGESTPDPARFDSFSPELRRDMLRETELLLQEALWRDWTVQQLFDPPHAYLNQALAEHYGIEGVWGDRFRPVTLSADAGRGGILTQASILTLTSYPTRTSPVKRGKWILEQLLDDAPPPPPPEVPDLEENAEAIQAASLRERLEEHRKNPDCASCHSRMDPLGFALEHYDAIGRWRDADGPHAIDARASLPNGTELNGAGELLRVLMDDPRLPRAFAKNLLTYGLGRGLREYEEPVVEDIVRRAEAEGSTLSAFLRAVVHSRPFQEHRGSEDSF